MKKTLIAAVALSASFVLTACGGGDDDRPSYEVKGRVVAKQIDYECGKALSVGADMDTVAYTRVAGGTSGNSSKPKKTGKTDTDSDTGSGGTSGGVSKEKKPTVAPPRTVNPKDIPTRKPKKPKGYDAKHCHTEYELFVKYDGDVYEQDVSQEHYERCDKRERFPKCAR